MRDLRSAGETSRGHANGDDERTEAWAGEEESPDVISSCRWLSVTGMRGAVDAFGNALDDESQL